jgi:PEP-CTERM motif
MKKVLAFSFLVLAAAASSPADTVTVLCPTSGGNGLSGISTTTCNSAAPITFSALDSIVLTFKFDADFGLGSGSVLEAFDVLPVGPGDAFGGLFDHPTNQIVTDTVRGIVGTFTILNPTIAQVDAALSGLVIQDKWSSGSGSFNDAAFDYQVDVNYMPGTNTGDGDGTGTTPAPEPGTFVLFGAGLLGLLAFAKLKV